MGIRPRLKYLGAFGLQRTLTVSETVIQMGLRRRITVRTDDARGALSWQLTYPAMPGTANGTVQLDGDEGLGPQGTQLPRADYLWRFIASRKAAAVRSFIITDLFDGKDYLVEYDGPTLTFEMFKVKLFSATGVRLVQVDEPDVQTLDDGSLGVTTENNQQI